jgi:hypothetical protein
MKGHEEFLLDGSSWFVVWSVPRPSYITVLGYGRLPFKNSFYHSVKRRDTNTVMGGISGKIVQDCSLVNKVV